MTFVWLRPVGKWILRAVVHELLTEYIEPRAPIPPPDTSAKPGEP